MLYCYRLTNMQNGRQYIGITNSVSRRYTEYCCKSPKAGSYLKNAILKYKIDAFKLDILAYGPNEEIFQLEKQYIKQLCTKAPLGYNLSDGGESGSAGYCKTELHRQRLSKSLKGKHVSEETRQKISVNASKYATWDMPKNSKAISIGGIEYVSMSEAARALNIKVSTLYQQIRRRLAGKPLRNTQVSKLFSSAWGFV